MKKAPFDDHFGRRAIGGQLWNCASGAAMKIETAQLESGWDLILQDTLLDVAAAIAATEPELAVAPKERVAAQPVLALRWTMRESIGKAS